MPTEPLTADQIATLRYQYLSDVKEERTEWGPNAAVATSAAAGAATLAVDGLIGPTVRRRTRIVVWSGGTSFPCDVVGSDVTVVAGAATIAISPILPAAIAADSRVEALPYLKGPWARYHGATYFQDEDIQDLALRALSRWGEVISRSNDPDESLFRAVRSLAFERMLGDDDFIQALAADDRGASLSEMVKAKRDLADRDRAFLKHPTSRSVNFSVTR